MESFEQEENPCLAAEPENKRGFSKIQEEQEDDKLPCQIPMDEEMRLKKIWGQPHLQIQLYDYIVDHSQVDEVVRELREETMKMKHPVLASTLDQIPVMAMLTSLSQAKCVVDIGTFTGISALQFALAIPKDGFVITIDKSDAKLEFAKSYWRKAGVLHKIDARVGDASDVLQQVKSEGFAGKIDLAFVDADKPSYDKYYEALMTMMKPGGLILFDNILRMARVADAQAMDEHTCCMRALNQKLYNDRRVTYTIIPSGVLIQADLLHYRSIEANTDWRAPLPAVAPDITFNRSFYFSVVILKNICSLEITDKTLIAKIHAIRNNVLSSPTFL